MSILLFNSLSEYPLREEHAMNRDASEMDKSINLKEMLLSFLGCTEARAVDRLEIAYQSIEIQYIKFRI
jgi:hypothetical protein